MQSCRASRASRALILAIWLRFQLRGGRRVKERPNGSPLGQCRRIVEGRHNFFRRRRPFAMSTFPYSRPLVLILQDVFSQPFYICVIAFSGLALVLISVSFCLIFCSNRRTPTSLARATLPPSLPPSGELTRTSPAPLTGDHLALRSKYARPSTAINETSCRSGRIKYLNWKETQLSSSDWNLVIPTDINDQPLILRISHANCSSQEPRYKYLLYEPSVERTVMDSNVPYILAIG